MIIGKRATKPFVPEPWICFPERIGNLVWIEKCNETEHANCDLWIFNQVECERQSDSDRYIGVVFLRSIAPITFIADSPRILQVVWNADILDREAARGLQYS